MAPLATQGAVTPAGAPAGPGALPAQALEGQLWAWAQAALGGRGRVLGAIPPAGRGPSIPCPSPARVGVPCVPVPGARGRGLIFLVPTGPGGPAGVQSLRVGRPRGAQDVVWEGVTRGEPL